MARSGLVSYGGDSEISDSEDERLSVSSSPPVSSTSVMPTNSLGIPFSQPRTLSTPPSLPTLKIEAAPTTVLGLVDYTYIEEDDDRHDSKGDLVEEVDDELVPEQLEESEMLTYQSEDMPTIEIDESLCSVPLFLQTANILLPPEPAAKSSNHLRSKITSLLQKKASSGVDMNSSLQSRKDVRNPSILEKLVHFCDINELGSNYPDHLYKSNEFTEESMYDNLYLEQLKDYNAKKEKAKLNSIEFISATKKQSAVAAPTKEKPETTKKLRRTKWDIGTSNADSGGSRGTSPTGGRERPALLGNAPIGLQPRVLQAGVVGAQARAQASQVSQELKKTMK